jgi:hypothetical protein
VIFMKKWFIISSVLALLALSCGVNHDSQTLVVTWTFDAGDCASNNIETVRVTWGPQNGTLQTVNIPCGSGSASLGTVGEGTYSLKGQGIDASGIARAESYGTTLTLSGQGFGNYPVDITLHPKTADVLVTWSIQGSPCPSGVILPYLITLYDPPDTLGGPLTTKVTETQESCASGQATLTNVAPGSYVVVLDSRAITPYVRLTAPVTVLPGENAQVYLHI